MTADVKHDRQQFPPQHIRAKPDALWESVASHFDRVLKRQRHRLLEPPTE